MAEAERIYHQNLSNLHNFSKQCFEEQQEEEENRKRKMVARQAQSDSNGYAVIGNEEHADANVSMGNGDSAAPDERTRLLPTTTVGDDFRGTGLGSKTQRILLVRNFDDGNLLI